MTTGPGKVNAITIVFAAVITFAVVITGGLALVLDFILALVGKDVTLGVNPILAVVLFLAFALVCMGLLIWDDRPEKP